MVWSWRILNRLQAVDLTDDKFWNAVSVWNAKPHLLIKTLISAERIFSESLAGTSINAFDSLVDLSCHWAASPAETFKDVGLSSGENIQVEVWRMLTKLVSSNDYLRLSIFDKKNNSALFHNFTTSHSLNKEKYAYSINLVNGQLELHLAVPSSESKDLEKTTNWLSNVFLPKFLNWAKNDNGSKSTISSLTHICIKKYRHLYTLLKLKYVNELMKAWTEVTDPYKYIHKDIATATYLIVMWSNETETKPRFVDMGCGNGLLVHILNSEGYEGVGLDVRSRKMWAQYPKSTILKINSIDPSASECKFPEADWIIGNHSDELSPWIPVIASRSNYNCKFFLLPCCPFEFNGSRYQRQNSSVSQYNDYLKYLEETSRNVFKFNVKIDRLRIPSTKRTCIIGWQKNYLPEEVNQVVQEVESFANSKFKENVTFVPRPSEERVRNCTKLDKDLIGDVVHCASNILIRHGGGWTTRVTLGDLAKQIGEKKLKKLKNECGGLQTLLRNHRYIFVVENGKVGFRKPENNAGRVKKKHRCWFYYNYPDKCPLKDEECCYLH